MSRKPKELKPVNEYLKGQGRYRHLDEGMISQIQDGVNKKWEKLNKLAEMTATPEKE